jgi:hypothetical protein
MDTPNPNYFMNRLHVHNGPSNWPIPPAFGSELDIYGHWDVSHPSSFPSPSNTIYDLTSRGDVDALIQPGSTSKASTTKGVGPVSTTNAMKYIPMNGHGFNILKQPGNPYHTDTYGFFGPSSFSFVMTWNSVGPHEPHGRLTSCRPGYDFESTMRWGPSSPYEGKLYFYTGAWTAVSPPQIDYVPRPKFEEPGPKVSVEWPSWIVYGMRYNAPSPTGRFRFWNYRTPTGDGFQEAQSEPAPTQPRTGSTRWGVFGNPGPDTASGENINGWFSEAIFLGKAQPPSNMSELAEGIMQYYNITPPGGQHPDFFWDGTAV